ncbi:unnamed protein product [Durusdinium trenchii]|uniref:DNA-directed RNA polymerase RpoA/D/Rpb3-type domain-containing protein n=1 Tax=Durusdinium trenchii TaxID=1381693 RepID=A0ABP0M7R5_9DINO
MMKRKSRTDAGYAEAEATESRRIVQEQQSLLRLTTEGPSNIDSKDFCGAFAALGLDNSWDSKAFKKDFKIDIKTLTDEHVVFDMIGIDPPLVNAFRRVLIAEVPTVAISRVTIHQNTSVIHDENFAHRLGLVPIKFEPDLLESRHEEADFTDQDSVLFKLHAKCPQGQKQLSVYSRDLRWTELSVHQREQLKEAPPAPVDGDILLAQLAPGQEIECDCYCEKGIGKDHAKWSPVCTAFYKLHPVIRFEKDIVGKDAEDLKRCCPMEVFDVEDVPQLGKRAVVRNARNCTTCRECLETFPGQEKGLFLGKAKNHFIFSIESVGQIPAPELFERALIKFKERCQTAKENVSHRRGAATK